jgi:hypothetical protein
LETKTAECSLCFIAFHGVRGGMSLGQRSRIGRSSILRPSFRGKASHAVVRCAREGVFFSEQLASRTILSPLHIHRETPEFRLQELLAQLVILSTSASKCLALSALSPLWRKGRCRQPLQRTCVCSICSMSGSIKGAGFPAGD